MEYETTPPSLLFGQADEPSASDLDYLLPAVYREKQAWEDKVELHALTAPYTKKVASYNREREENIVKVLDWVSCLVVGESREVAVSKKFMPHRGIVKSITPIPASTGQAILNLQSKCDQSEASLVERLRSLEDDPRQRRLGELAACACEVNGYYDFSVSGLFSSPSKRRIIEQSEQSRTQLARHFTRSLDAYRASFSLEISESISLDVADLPTVCSIDDEMGRANLARYIEAVDIIPVSSRGYMLSEDSLLNIVLIIADPKKAQLSIRKVQVLLDDIDQLRDTRISLSSWQHNKYTSSRNAKNIIDKARQILQERCDGLEAKVLCGAHDLLRLGYDSFANPNGSSSDDTVC